MEIDHINIKASPALLERVRTFYCTILGLEEGFRPALSSAGHWLYGSGRAIVHLSQGEGQLRNTKDSCLDHVAFKVDDDGALQKRLEASGIPYRSSRIDELELVQYFLHDPAGNGIEINCHYGGKE